MRIAILCWESLHSIMVGGLAAHVSELAVALRQRGHDIHLFTRLGTGQSRYDLIEGVHYHRCEFDPHADFPTYIGRMCDSFVHRLKDVEDYLDRPFDLVHGHDWLTTQAMVRVRNELDRPIIFTIHSTEYGRCGNQIHGGLSESIRHHEWEGAFSARRVICVSQSLKREVEWLYNVPSDKIGVIYNGVVVERFETGINVEAVRRRHGIGAHDPVILFAGRVVWQKGPDLLIEALPDVLRKYPGAKAVFAGDGDMRAALQDRAGAMGLSEAVRFVGHRSGLELISLFKMADVVCVPSRNEPFGIVILEGWSAAKPVVVTRTGGPSEFVCDRQNGIVVASPQADAIATGLMVVLGDPALARRIGANGRSEAQGRFSWGRVAVETETIYETVVGKMNSSPDGDHHPNQVRREIAWPEKTQVVSGNPRPKPEQKKINRSKLHANRVVL